MQQSSDDTRINWQLLAIRALVKEGKTGQAVELFNQLPQELNDSQRREKTLLAAEIKLAQKDFAGAQNLLAKITPADLEQNQQARYWPGKNRCQPGRPSIDLLRALIAQEPLLGAKEKQQNIDATWPGALLHDSGTGEYAGDQRRRKYSARLAGFAARLV